MGWKVFLRAVNLLIENLPEALRVSAVPYLVVIVASGLLLGGEGAPPAELDGAAPRAGAELAALPDGVGTIVLLNLLVLAWVSVPWHRFVLAGEAPTSWVPRIAPAELWGYLWRFLMVLAIASVAALGIMIPVVALGAAIPPLLIAGPLVGLYIATLVIYRIGMILPARALGERMTLRQAMEATRSHTGTVAGLAALMLILPLLLQVPTILDGGAGAITAVYQGVVGWIGLMIGVSTLTTLYGVAIEGRPLE
jgi:hypothetical protein